MPRLTTTRSKRKRSLSVTRARLTRDCRRRSSRCLAKSKSRPRRTAGWPKSSKTLTCDSKKKRKLKLLRKSKRPRQLSLKRRLLWRNRKKRMQRKLSSLKTSLRKRRNLWNKPRKRTPQLSPKRSRPNQSHCQNLTLRHQVSLVWFQRYSGAVKTVTESNLLKTSKTSWRGRKKRRMAIRMRSRKRLWASPLITN